MTYSDGAKESAGQELSSAGTPVADRKGQLGWILFSGARDFYGIICTVYIFAPYVANTVVGDPVRGQVLWGYVSGISGLMVALLGPCLGAIADVAGRRKPWIAVFLATMVPSLFVLWWSLPNDGGIGIWATIALFTWLAAAYYFTDVFYGAMLPSLAGNDRLGLLSGYAVVFSQFSALIGLLVLFFCFMLPGQVDWSFVPSQPLFGLDAASYETSRISAPVGGLWLLLFSLPLFMFTPDTPRNKSVTIPQAVTSGLKRVVQTARQLRHYRNVATFLLTRMFFADGQLGIMTFGAIYAVGTFKWEPLTLTAYGVLMTLFSISGGFIGGWLDKGLGSKRTIIVAVAVTSLGLMLALSITPSSIFFFFHYPPDAIPTSYLPFFKTLPELIYLLIILILVIFNTAAYVSSRAMLARIAPLGKMGEFFGLFALSGTATAFLGPVLVGFATYWSGSQRVGMAALLLLLGIGFAGMFLVREERATEVPSSQ